MDLHHRSTGYESVALLLSYTGILRSQPFQGHAGAQFNFTALGFTFSPVDQTEWRPSADTCALTDLNRRLPACKAGALPAELSAHIVAPPNRTAGLSPIVATSTPKCLNKLIKWLVTNIENQTPRCLPLPTRRCLLLPTSRRKWFASFLVSAEASRYSGVSGRELHSTTSVSTN